MNALHKKNKEAFCGAKIAENVRIGPAGRAWRGVSGAKSARIALFSPAGQVEQVKGLKQLKLYKIRNNARTNVRKRLKKSNYYGIISRKWGIRE